MVREYLVERKLHEQGGSYFVFLPKIWVKAEDLREGAIMQVAFNEIVKIMPPKTNRSGGGED